MAYVPLTLSDDVDPAAERVVREVLEPLFRDVHAMLRLPKGWAGLEAGCNLSATLVLLSIVSGVSVRLYDPSPAGGGRNSGRLFKDVLQNHYPWAEEPTDCALPKEEAAKRLYNAFRNPLTHSLGLYVGDPIGRIKVAKGPLKEAEIEMIEAAGTRPREWQRPALWSDGVKTILNVKSFYWGIRKLVCNVASTHCLLGRFGSMEAAATTQEISGTATSTPTIGPAQVGSGPTTINDNE